MDELKVISLQAKAAGIFEEIKKAFLSSADESISSLAERVPSQLIDKEKLINIVFVGQYSAGKSTILSRLTGQNLKIGGGVTTDEVASFEYKGMFVSDTPGVHSQNRPDHDAITYDAIAKADLLVFVVTNEPIGEFMGEHLRHLLMDMGKAKETMIVVNKMMDSVGGNTPEQQAIYIEKNLNPIIAPYTAEDFYTSFIDMDAYDEYLSSGDEDFLTDSGFESFKNNLDRFIHDRNLIGKCSTSLYEVEHMLENVIDSHKIGDFCVDGCIHQLNVRRRELEETRIRILEKTKAIVSNDTNQIEYWGDEIAGQLKSSDKQEEVNARLAEKYKSVTEVSDKLVPKIEKMLSAEVGALNKSLDGLQDTQFARDLQEAIQKKIQEKELDPKTNDGLQKTSQYAGEIGNWLSKQATGANAAANQSIAKLAQYSGSNAHSIVLNVGHLFGHKFVPWEAVKWARGIGVAGKCLGVVGAGLGIILQISNDRQNAKAEANLAIARGEIRSCFKDVSNAIEMKYDEATGIWVKENIDPCIEEIDRELAEIQDIIKAKNDEYNHYLTLLGEVRTLIAEIHD